MGGAVILNWVLGAIIVVLIVGGGIYAASGTGRLARTTGTPAGISGPRTTRRSRPWVSTCPPSGWPPRVA